MARKIVPAISLGVITILAILFITDSGPQNRSVLESTFQVEAIYYDTGIVEISYYDKSQKTSGVVLEILGMEKSFQKTFSESEFVETVPFPHIPKYGWQIHPITFLIDHEELGQVSLKTEIHPLGEPVPPVIYGNQ